MTADNTDSRTRKQRPSRVLLVVVVAAALGTLLYFSLSPPARNATLSQSSSQEQVDYYCPMHPTYHSPAPGNCPVCSMKLVKLEKANTAAPPSTEGEPMPGMEAPKPPAEGSAAPVNSIYVAPQKQQLIGMRSVAATVQPLVKEIRTVGKISYDETKVTHIHTKVSGYIEDVYADYIGKPVKRGEPLFTIYSPDLVSTQQEYLLALKSRNILKGSALPEISRGGDNLLLAARERLRLWDVSPEEMERLESSGAVKQAIAVHSPVSGVVTERAAYHHGTYVDPTMELFTIVDLSRVWVLGDIYESDLPFVRTGQLAEVNLPAGARTLRGRISFISPFLDPRTRTAQIRIEFENSDFTLKPDMFAEVRLHAGLGSKLVVPQDAVLNTGTEQFVFLDLGEGYVEPRRVEVAATTGESVAVLKGLKSGDRVVTAANFIIDAESRLKGAFENMGQPVAPSDARAAIPGEELAITLLEPKQAKVGPNLVQVFVKDASGSPLDGAEVEVSLFMPQMGAMAPMSAKAQLQNTGGEQYEGTVDVPMAWTWQTTITVRKGERIIGSTQTSITAR